MSEAEPSTSAEQSASLDAKVAWGFCRYAGGWWTGPSARQAWFLTVALALCLAGATAAGLALNYWQRWFFDALEKKDISAFGQSILGVALIIVAMAAVGVGIVLARETLQVRWRAWLIDKLVERWVGERRFYRMSANRTEPANPEYRIADDTRWAIEHLTDLAIGLVIAVLNAATFISVLWTVGGSYRLPIGTGFEVPAYMVIVAVIYGALMSLLMIRVGWRLPGFVYAKNEREGDFRFAMMRLRENAESVALMDGHRAEQAILKRMFHDVVQSWSRVISKHGHLTWITNSTGPLLQNQIVPLMFAAPKYLAGELTLGQVTQLAGAFVIVQGAISWLVDNFSRFSDCYASAKRIMDIVEACDAADRARIAVAKDTGLSGALALKGLSLEGVSLSDPQGAPVLSGLSFDLRPGSSTYVLGETSSGKSTLARAIAGLTAPTAGRISVSSDCRVMVLPQKPYIPLGSVAAALGYPGERKLDAATIGDALEAVGLPGFATRFDEQARWDQRLSNGERQRLALARALVHRPDILVIDDALSALDASAQVELFRVLRKRLPDAAILTLGQAKPPEGLHDRVLFMTRNGTATTVIDPSMKTETPERVT